jgi:hypothetical protein
VRRDPRGTPPASPTHRAPSVGGHRSAGGSDWEPPAPFSEDRCGRGPHDHRSMGALNQGSGARRAEGGPGLRAAAARLGGVQRLQ